MKKSYIILLTLALIAIATITVLTNEKELVDTRPSHSSGASGSAFSSGLGEPLPQPGQSASKEGPAASPSQEHQSKNDPEAFRRSSNIRALAHKAIIEGELVSTDLAITYYGLCSGVPDEWFAGTAANRGGEKMTQAREQLVAACSSYRGDLQMLRAVVARRKALEGAKFGSAGESTHAKLMRMVQEGNSESAIFSIAVMPEPELFKMLRPLLMGNETAGIQDKHLDFLVRMSVEASVCSILGCDDRFRYVTHCMADKALCDIHDVEKRFEYIATSAPISSRTSYVQWAGLRKATDAFVRGLQ